MVIVTSKRSSSYFPCSNHQSAHRHCYCWSGSWWPEARSAAVHCTVPARHLTFSGSEYLRQSLTSVKGETAQDLSKLCPWCWRLPIRNLSELISVFHQTACSTSSSPKFPLLNAELVVLKMWFIFSFLLRHLYVILPPPPAFFFPVRNWQNDSWRDAPWSLCSQETLNQYLCHWWHCRD